MRKSLVLFALIFTASCSQLTESNPKVVDTQTQTSQGLLFGGFKNTEDIFINLDDSNYDALVLIFASDTCSTCAEEAHYWRESFSNFQPSNIQFVHYLLGGYKEDAQNWKQAFQIQWDVLYHESDDLYRSYCPAIITPCLLIYNKKTKTLTQTYKPLRKNEIELLTGEWK